MVVELLLDVVVDVKVGEVVLLALLEELVEEEEACDVDEGVVVPTGTLVTRA